MVFCKQIGDVKPGVQGYKLVPWLNWDEWNFVRESLFSSSKEDVALAMRRISTWQSRGCVPAVINCTVDFIDAQQKDPFFSSSGNPISETSHADKLLASLYSMACIRLVNAVIEKTRKRNEISISEAAAQICLPRMLIDLRHEASHKDLPSAQLARHASVKALDWLKSYYWEPQKNAILLQSNQAPNIRKEIKFRLHELALSLKFKQTSQSNLQAKTKGKHVELFPASSKFFSLAARKHLSLTSKGSKNRTTRALKNLVRLYSSYPSEVVSLLLEFLTKTARDSQIVTSADCLQSSVDDWKALILRLSKKEPELLLDLISAALDIMIQDREAMKSFTGEEHLRSMHGESTSIHTEHLSSLIPWFVGNLQGLIAPCSENPASESEGFAADTPLPKTALMELLRKCLVASDHGRDQVVGSSSLLLAQILRNNKLVDKLTKLSKLHQTSVIFEENLSLVNSENFIEQQEYSLLRAAAKLDYIKHRQVKEKLDSPVTHDLGSPGRWAVAKCWNPCPIGMLPGGLGFPARFPVLDLDDGPKRVHESLSDSENDCDLIRCNCKREASCDMEFLSSVKTKKMRETAEGCVTDGGDAVSDGGVKGLLMIGGVWKTVGEEELCAIQSNVRVLI